MQTKTKIGVGLLATFLLFAGAASTQALSGYKTDDVKVKIFAKPNQAKHWFRALYLRTDKDGVLEVKNVLPGSYKLKVRGTDQKKDQRIAARFKMLDDGGNKIKEVTPVEVYRYTNKGEEIDLGKFYTDKEGWLELSVIYPEKIYKLVVKGNTHLGKKANRVRIKVKAKIEDTKWFRSLYKRTNKARTLEIKNVRTGKYKFAFNPKDATVGETFNLHLKMLDNKASRIKKPTKVNVYSYVNGQKALIGTVYTDARGWITLPEVVTQVRYKLSVVD